MAEILSRCFPPPPSGHLPRMTGEESESPNLLPRRTGEGREGEGNRTGVEVKSSSIRKQLPGLGPVLFLDVGQDDLHRVGRAAQRAAGALGKLFRELAALLECAALEHLDVD